MSNRDYVGAKWWKFDFHTHSPASYDFMKKYSQADRDAITPGKWLQEFMAKGIDCVAITDHNSGEWVDKLQQARAAIEQEDTDQPWYRPLYLFPGVEISVNGSIHVLAIFNPDKKTSDIDSLLGAVGYSGEKGSCDKETDKSATEVIEIITAHGGIPVPAHVDRDKGLFKLEGNTLKQILKSEHCTAMELCDEHFNKPQIYTDEKVQWTEVCGSDTHDFQQDKFGNFTWVKMDTPSIEGLKLALIDGSASINRDMQADPNHHSDHIIEEIEISHAKYMGRKKPGIHQFSPFLNAIIGGRGSGKSTLLEFMRFVLRRDKEIPEPLRKENSKYFEVGGDNLLLENSTLSLIYRKGSTRYRLNWSQAADKPSLEVEIGENWTAEAGEIRSLFPVYIYSQKQIFHLAQKPDALLEIIDKDPSVRFEDVNQKHIEFKNRYKRLQQKIAEFKEKVAQRQRIRGLLSDVSRQVEEIEKSGHKNVLQKYRQRRRQLSIIENTEMHWQGMMGCVREAQQSIAPVDVDEKLFNDHPDILQAITTINNRWSEINATLDTLHRNSQTILNQWQQQKETAQWMKDLTIDLDKYQQLRTHLEKQSIDPDKYPNLLQQQSLYTNKLKEIGGYDKKIEESEKEQQETLQKLLKNRKDLTKNRKLFLNSILTDNNSISITVQPFWQDWDDIEKRLRQLLHCPDRFEKDFEELKNIYKQQSNKDESICKIKEQLIGMCSSDRYAKDKRFANHINGLQQDSISELTCWFPEDSLEITFAKKRKLQHGSPGQKTAALLAFILSYGTEPLLLDQPEDDLDNELIYNLIVKQLQNTKSKRQIIIVTHNANIVVNGNAEMVLPLTVTNGQSFVKDPASIQNNSIRTKICDILEGGQQAFEQRYRRIHLEQSDA